MKNYTTSNSIQEYMKKVCIAGAEQFKQDNQEVVIQNENIYDWNGTLSFTLSINAKENTGLMCLFNKAWVVTIGRRGAVSSKKIGVGMGDKTEPMKRNKYCTFI